MNYSMVKRLILKDWYFLRFPILLSLAGGLASLGIIMSGSNAGFMIGLILLITVMIANGALMVMSTMVGEREHQTLPFIMSLPISYVEYSSAKVLANLLIFFVFWLTLTLGSLGVILAAPQIHGMFAFATIMAVEILTSTCLMISVALVTESKGWTISAMMVGNLGINVVGYFVAHIPSIASGLFGKVIQWTPAATISLLVEFGLIALMLGVAFFIQSRKQDFI